MRRPSLKVSRDAILFVGGMAGIFYQTVTNGVEKPTLLFMYAGMVGLPMFIRNDEQRRPPLPEPEEEEEEEP